MCKIKENFDKSTRIEVVETLVLSLINYCSRIWGSTNKTQIKRVQKLQNFAAKVAHGNSRKYDYATPIINELKWLKVEQKCFNYICTVTCSNL